MLHFYLQRGVVIPSSPGSLVHFLVSVGRTTTRTGYESGSKVHNSFQPYLTGIVCLCLHEDRRSQLAADPLRISVISTEIFYNYWDSYFKYNINAWTCKSKKTEQRWALQSYSLTFSRSLIFSRVRWSTTEGSVIVVVSWKSRQANTG